MKTQCTGEQLEFHALGRRSVIYRRARRIVLIVDNYITHKSSITRDDW